MYLSKLRLSGFKSFADEVEIGFTEGITCIVGPNGCGKSNIVDAIRWVLGEHNPRQIRAETLDELIFAGGNGYQPAGMVEVEVIFEDASEFSPENKNTLSIKRQLFRSKDSKFFINGKPCRLKNIKELFYDTGIGKVAYSIMVQGMVDKVLSDRPRDRREIFEEAVGITGYRETRERTLQKLGGIEDNIERLNDILKEVKKQEKKLRVHREKAIQYRELMEELKEVELALNSGEFNSLNEEYEELNQRYEELVHERDKTRGLLIVTEKEQSELRKQVTQHRIESDEMSDEIKVLSEEVYNREKDLAVISETINHLKESIEEKKRRETEIDEHQKSLQDEKRAMSERLEELREYENRLMNVITRVEGAIDGKRLMIKTKSELQEEMKGSVLESELELDDMEYSVAELNKRKDRIEIEIESLRREEDFVEGKLEDVTDEITDLLGKVDKQDRDIEETSEDYNRKSDELKSLRDRRDEKHSQIGICERELEKKKVRLNFVEDAYKSSDRLPQIVRKGASGEIERIADMMEVEGKYRNAFASVVLFYGDALHCKNVEDTLKKLSQTELDSGITLMSSGDRQNTPDIKDKTFEGDFLENHLNTKSSKLPAVEKIFAGIGMVEDWKEGWKLMNAGGMPGGGVVSLDGVYFHPSNMITIAGSEDRVMARQRLKSEMKQLRKTMGERETELEKLSGEHNNLTGKIEECEVELENLDEKLRDLNSSKELRVKHIEALREEERRFKGRGEVLLGAISNLKTELEEILAEIDSKMNRATSIREGKERDKDEIVNADEEIDKNRGWIEHWRNRLISLKEKKSKIESKIENLEDSSSDLNNRVINARERLDTVEGELAELRDELERCIEKRDKTDEELSRSKSELKKLMGLNNELKENLGPEEIKLERLERKVVEYSRKLQRYEEEIGELREKKTVISGEMDVILNELEGKYELERDDIMSVEIPDDFDFEEAPERVKNLSRDIKGLGRINFTAEEEYDNLKERLDFLKEQNADLEEAKDNLIETLQNLDERSEKVFKEGLEEIDRSYKEVFREFFDGGEASVKVEDGFSLLEGGIEIECMPHGKRMASIGLLSGGEKALAALALIFAIQRIKPTPFSILDEVDATLDDTNTFRFIEFINNHKDRQMILITHNRLTMREADTLIGVSMETPGVSTLIPVDLRTLEDELGEKV